MANIVGIEGLSVEQVRAEVAKGARFVVFTYVVSILILTFRRPTSVYFIRAGESTFAKALPWIVISGLFGWWGFPFGLIFTPWSIIENLSGGKNVTTTFMGALGQAPGR